MFGVQSDEGTILYILGFLAPFNPSEAPATSPPPAGDEAASAR